MQRVKLFAILAIALAAICIAPAARADTFNLNVVFCTTGCNGGLTSAGQVVVTSEGTDSSNSDNIVDVKVSLASGLQFHDFGLETFAFNISSFPGTSSTNTIALASTLADKTLVVVSSGGSPWTLDVPSGNADGAGSFEYGLECTGAANGCSGYPTVLEFKVEASGLKTSDFEVVGSGAGNGHNVDFAANVAVASGSCTGMVGGGNGTSDYSPGFAGSGTCGSTPSTPEVSSIGFFGTGLLVAGWVLRRKLITLW